VAEAQTDNEESGAESDSSAGVGRFLYRLALAGVGSVVLAQEEISGLFRRSEDSDEDEGSEEEPSSDDDDSGAANDPATRHMYATVDRVLHTFNLPSRGDVDELTQKIDALAAKVEALKG
jgi:hypothetical protein